jgi:hypothetical protein
VIVDSVLKIRNGLTKNAKAAEASEESARLVIGNGINGVNGSVAA